MFPKPKRIRDRKLLAKYRQMACAACGGFMSVSGHHIKTRGAGGDDVESNLIALCISCHTLIHKVGEERICRLYPHLKQYFKK